MKSNDGLLVVSFGTSYEETRKCTLEAIERDLQAAFPDRVFFRAWTSRRIIKKLRETQGLHYDTVAEALEKMLAARIENLLVQPTHMLVGAEYAALEETLRTYRPRFQTVACGAPLIGTPEDVKPLAAALEEVFAPVVGRHMLVLMGHGSAQEPFSAYRLLDQQFQQDGFANFCVGTVEYTPGIDPVLGQVRREQPERVYLSPLLVVAGDHALHDMAGADPDSWKNQLVGEGVEVCPILRGIGEYPAIRALYVDHAKQAKSME